MAVTRLFFQVADGPLGAAVDVVFAAHGLKAD